MTIPVVTRAEIEAEIATKLNRPDLLGNVSSFFDFAHREIQRRYDWLCMQRTWRISLSDPLIVDAHRVPAPNDIKKPHLLYWFNTTTKKIKQFYNQTSIETIRLARLEDSPGGIWAINAWSSGVVVYPTMSIYAVWEDTLELFPDIEGAGVSDYLYFDYYSWLASPGQNSFNWFTTNARDYLTYEALVHSAPFLVADPRIKTWQTLADKAYVSLLSADTDSKYAGELIMRG